MWAIAIDDPGRRLSVNLLRLRCAKMAEWIEVLFGLSTLGVSIRHGEGREIWEFAHLQEHC